MTHHQTPGQDELLEDCRAAFAQIKKLAPGPANWQDIDWICAKALAALDHPGEPGHPSQVGVSKEGEG